MKNACGKPETEEHNEYLSSSLRQKSRAGEICLEKEILNSGLLKGRAASRVCKVVSMYELASAAVTNQMCSTWWLPNSSLDQKSTEGTDGVRSAGQVLSGGSTGEPSFWPVSASGIACLPSGPSSSSTSATKDQVIRSHHRISLRAASH